MTPRAIRTQHGIIAYNALPNDASVEDRIGAAMDVAFEEGKREAFEVPTVAELEKCFSETAYLAPIVKPWAHEHAPGIRKAIVAWRFWRQDNIRALSSAPPPATAQPRSEESLSKVLMREVERQTLKHLERGIQDPTLRDAFESWMASSNYPEIADIALAKLPDGEYKSQITYAGWQGWQAALREAKTTPSPKPEDALREAANHAVLVMRSTRCLDNRSKDNLRDAITKIRAALAKEGKAK